MYNRAPTLWEAAVRGIDAHRTQKYLHLNEQAILLPFYASVSPIRT